MMRKGQKRVVQVEEIMSVYDAETLPRANYGFRFATRISTTDGLNPSVMPWAGILVKHETEETPFREGSLLSLIFCGTDPDEDWIFKEDK